jgi:hypothetical protein
VTRTTWAFVIVSLFGTHAVAAESADWVKVGTDKGITVSRRKVEGSNLHEFRGRGLIDAKIKDVLAVIFDANRRGEWMFHCVGSWFVDKPAANQEIAYNRTHLPWPVSDRDVVLHGQAVVDVAHFEVDLNFESVTDPRVPPYKGVVRMPELTGHWSVRAVNGGKSTCVEYQVHANPGGHVPDWLADQSSRELPRKTLEGLRRQVAHAHYAELIDYKAIDDAVAANGAPVDNDCAFAR